MKTDRNFITLLEIGGEGGSIKINKKLMDRHYLVTVADEVKDFVASEYSAYIHSERRSDYIGHSWKRMFDK